MIKLISIGIFALLGLVNLTLAFEPGTQYVYRYVGRVTTGIGKISDDNAAMEVECRVVLQSVDRETAVIKLRDGRIRRNGSFSANAYHAQTIEGVEDPVPDEQFLGAPFVVHHKLGSFVDVEIDAREPDWVVNFKKGIVSQIQIDLTSVRPNGPAADLNAVFSQGHSATFDVFEDSVTGDCSTTIRVNRLTGSRVFETEAFKLGSFDAVCQGKPVYEIVKSKHYNNCKTYPVFYSAYPATYDCTPGRPNCGEYMQRTSTTRFIACGDSVSKLTFVHANSYSNLLPSPFGTKSEKLVALSVTEWSLETKEPISSRLMSAPGNPTVHKSLAYVFDEFQQRDECGKPVQPSLTGAYLKKPSVESHAISKLILDALRIVAKDLKEQPDSRRDNLERLSTIGRAVPMLSLDELRSLWQQVKNDDYVVITLFVDTVVQSGSNPAIMLVKELIENREITETKAAWALAAIGYYAKTPTRALLRELIQLINSNAVQSSKTLRQTASMTVADLLGSACASPHLAIKRFPIALLGDFCNAKDDLIVNEFLPLLVDELEKSEASADRIVALGSIGSLGTEEIIPILLPFIREAGHDGNTAERVRAIMSLFRVASSAPERVHNIAAAVAGNVNERAEVRMAALSLLFNSNAPLSHWQKFAASTWFEPSQQIVSYTYTLFQSFANLPAVNSEFADWREKARQALPMVKPAPFGAPYSFMDIRSSYMEDEDFGIYMATPQFRVADEEWPVLLVNRYFYYFGPFATDSLSAYFWNYNMGDVWNGILDKFYGKSAERASYGKARENIDFLRNMWHVLKATGRPADKRAGLFHLNLQGSINRAFNLENLDQLIPTYLAKMMRPNEPLDVSVTKFRLLSEFIVRLPNELGLPMRYYFGVPVLVSLQGVIRGDGSGFKSEMAVELSRKVTSELRVELPGTGHYIATGADNNVVIRAPKEIRVRYEHGQARVLWVPAKTATDLVYVHTKPYTIARHLSQSYVPFLEDESVRIVEKVPAKKRSFDVGSPLGVGLQFSALLDDEFADKVTFFNWLSKWDVNSISNLPFVPLTMRHRVYALRFEPAETQVRSVQLNFKYQYVTKASVNTIAYESGSSKPSKLTKAEINSASPIGTEFKPALDRLFENLESGNAHLLGFSVQSQRTDGTTKYIVSNLGLSKDAWYTKDFTDWNVQSYTTSASGKKDIDWNVCYWAIRDWNKAPTYGFSNDVLFLNEEDSISFGENCNESKIHFKARVYRDEEAAAIAKESPAGVQCQKDMTSGFKYGSPACAKARRMDHTYNVYEMSAQTEGTLPAPVSQFAYEAIKQLNYMLRPFITEHSVGEQNTPGSASWRVKLDPLTGASSMKFVRPHETVVAENVRIDPKWKPFSPLSYAYSRVFYPLNAETNFIRDAAALTSGGATEAKCYVGAQGVHTYDGALYNYTVDGCHHVLATDCTKKSEFAVLSRSAREGHKIVTVIIGKDSIELDPNGNVFVNGDRVLVSGLLDKEARVEIRSQKKNILAVVYPKPDEKTLNLEVRTLGVFVKVQKDHVTVSAPYSLRGKLCGLCGDYNQEKSGEFKTAERCAVSDGALMATSFKLSSGDGCSSLDDDELVDRLRRETSTCQSVDTYLPTQINEVDPTAATRCVRRQKLVIDGVQGQCKSEEEYVACQPGCKPAAQLTKPVSFKCMGNLSDFVSLVSVPTTCVSV